MVVNQTHTHTHTHSYQTLLSHNLKVTEDWKLWPGNHNLNRGWQEETFLKSIEVTLLLLLCHAEYAKTASHVAMAPSPKPRLLSTQLWELTQTRKKPIIPAGGSEERIKNNNNKKLWLVCTVDFIWTRRLSRCRLNSQTENVFLRLSTHPPSVQHVLLDFQN